MKRIELKKSSLLGKLLQLLKPKGGLSEAVSLQEDNVDVPVSSYYDYRREIETTMLEAERKKAKALMEWQKRRFVC